MTTEKALTVIGLLVILFGLTLVVPARYVGIQEPKRQGLILRSSEEISALRGDLDRNGTPDWKDLINETMSSSTKAAAEKIIVTEEEKKRLNDPNNITASFSKNIYIASAYAKQKGNLTKEEKEDLATLVLEGEKEKMAVRTYEITDLHLSKDESPATRKAYGNTLGKLYTRADTQKITSNDINILKEYSINKDTSVLASLASKTNILDEVIDSLLAMQVPYSAAPYHLLLVNNIAIYKSMLENFASAESDPLRVSIALSSYIPVMRGVSSSLASMQDYFIIENITFTKNEPGYAIISGYTGKVK